MESFWLPWQMLQRAVRDNLNEKFYWRQVHSSDVSSFEESPKRHKQAKVTTIDNIDDWTCLRPLLDVSIYAHSNHHLFSQLTKLIVTTGKHWNLSVPPKYFESDAGRALLMLSTIHAATKRIHCARKIGGSKETIVPTFCSLLPAFFWAPLVHRLGESKLWRKFYRQQHRLNTITFIKCGLAKPVNFRKTRYNCEDFVFKTDQELKLLWNEIKRSSSPIQLLKLMNIDPQDQQSLFS